MPPGTKSAGPLLLLRPPSAGHSWTAREGPRLLVTSFLQDLPGTAQNHQALSAVFPRGGPPAKPAGAQSAHAFGQPRFPQNPTPQAQVGPASPEMPSIPDRGALRALLPSASSARASTTAEPAAMAPHTRRQPPSATAGSPP